MERYQGGSYVKGRMEWCWKEGYKGTSDISDGVMSERCDEGVKSEGVIQRIYVIKEMDW